MTCFYGVPVILGVLADKLKYFPFHFWLMLDGDKLISFVEGMTTDEHGRESFVACFAFNVSRDAPFHLEREHIAVVPGNAYGDDYSVYVGIAFTKDIPVLEEACARIKHFSESLL